MANHKQLREIAQSRLKAGKTLLDDGDYDGAVYMMGYAIECALKAVICKRLNLASYPDQGVGGEIATFFKTHKFDILLTLSGLEKEFTLAAPQRRSENWSESTKWHPDMRYAPVGSKTKIEAERMHIALSERSDGILSWISKHRKW
jgi:HEPN domain-containing protein